MKNEAQEDRWVGEDLLEHWKKGWKGIFWVHSTRILRDRAAENRQKPPLTPTLALNDCRHRGGG